MSKISDHLRAEATDLVKLIATGHGFTQWSDGMDQLTDAAANLAGPVLDYETAAREAGFEVVKDPSGNTDYWIFRARQWVEDSGLCDTPYEAWQTCCTIKEIEPHSGPTPTEFWAVSDELADALEQAGQRVCRDFAGLTIWARVALPDYESAARKAGWLEGDGRLFRRSVGEDHRPDQIYAHDWQDACKIDGIFYVEAPEPETDPVVMSVVAPPDYEAAARAAGWDWIEAENEWRVPDESKADGYRYAATAHHACVMDGIVPAAER